ncbi:unnamed protein product [Malus baccata var. baccata]
MESSNSSSTSQSPPTPYHLPSGHRPHIEGLLDNTEFVFKIPLYLSYLLTLAIDRTRDQIQDFLKTSVADCKVNMIFFDSAHWILEIARGLGIKFIFYGVICAVAYALSLVPICSYVTKDACMAPMTMTEEHLNPHPRYDKVCLFGCFEWRGLGKVIDEFKGCPLEAKTLSSSFFFHADRSHARELLAAFDPSTSEASLMTSRSCGVGIRVNQRLITGFRAIKECDAFCLRTCREFECDFCDYLEAQFQKPVVLTGPVLSLEKGPKLLEERWVDWFAGFEAGSMVPIPGFVLTGLPFLVAVKPPLGFVHHCGYGIMWESLMSENQIVLVPQLVDQIVGAKLLAKELTVAVEVEREEDGWFSKESLRKAVKSLMDKESEVGVMVKKNHAKFREIISEPGWATLISLLTI